MSLKPYKALSVLTLTTAATLMAFAPVSQAFNFGNMMNPSRWMGGSNDRYDDRYDEPYWGGPYGGGYGYPGAYGSPYGMPYGAPGFGMPPAGYGAPGYGGAPATPQAAPQAPSSSSSEVEALKRRIEELEARQQSQQRPPASNDWPSAPAFRPMNQY
ncbi:hypothetical protein [Thiorhodococcus minor]|uniref:Sulfur globule protein CV1 n=1 Tax=Thiorhodococcus minor TaxID=57489 RepID=A0A6M0K4R4_9GAMM|nr:hypothetical protein [Thiorhodococcus minor]